jgi:pyrroloquinoline quinone biosynthesis protein E
MNADMNAGPDRQIDTAKEAAPEAPIALLAELTHRCPLRCPYCSNPLDLERRSAELGTEEWAEVFDQAAALGVIHLHLSGGEPTAREDLPALVGHASRAGLYTNLITSGVLLDEARLAALAEAGLDHVQLSVQDAEAANADRIAGFAGGHAKKRRVARAVRALGLPLTLNAVIHRQNVARLEAIVDLALELDAARLEVAHTQYYGWALKNRAALMPSLEQIAWATGVVEQAREALQGRLVIDYVVPDYHARFPKACMGGWGRVSLNVTPSGKVLPCHAAETIEHLVFDSVREKSLAEIWQTSESFRAFRGVDWMEEPCRSCERRELDWGGCRCQAFALAGRATATDPACALSPLHDELARLAAEEAAAPPPAFAYRRLAAKTPQEA